jgi:hypothetical protein
VRDSGCSKHMTINMNIYASLYNFVKIEFKLGDEKVFDSIGKGIVSVLTRKKFQCLFGSRIKI